MESLTIKKLLIKAVEVFKENKIKSFVLGFYFLSGCALSFIIPFMGLPIVKSFLKEQVSAGTIFDLLTTLRVFAAFYMIFIVVLFFLNGAMQVVKFPSGKLRLKEYLPSFKVIKRYILLALPVSFASFVLWLLSSEAGSHIHKLLSKHLFKGSDHVLLSMLPLIIGIAIFIILNITVSSFFVKFLNTVFTLFEGVTIKEAFKRGSELSGESEKKLIHINKIFFTLYIAAGCLPFLAAVTVPLIVYAQCIAFIETKKAYDDNRKIEAVK